MKMRILMLFAKEYSVADERTGQINQGITTSYYFEDDLKPKANTDGSRGTRPSKGTLADLNLMSKIKVAPAYYDAEFEMYVGSDGKPTLRIRDIEFNSDFVLPKAGKVA